MARLVRVDDKYISKDDLDLYMLVTMIAHRFGVGPSMSVEAEGLFIRMLSEFHGDLDDLELFLKESPSPV